VRPENPTLLDFLTLSFEDGQIVRSKTSGLKMRIVGLWEPGIYVVDFMCGLWQGLDPNEEVIVHDGFDLESVD
jgi:hypothetical protein